MLPGDCSFSRNARFGEKSVRILDWDFFHFCSRVKDFARPFGFIWKYWKPSESPAELPACDDLHVLLVGSAGTWNSCKVAYRQHLHVTSPWVFEPGSELERICQGFCEVGWFELILISSLFCVIVGYCSTSYCLWNSSFALLFCMKPWFSLFPSSQLCSRYRFLVTIWSEGLFCYSVCHKLSKTCTKLVLLLLSFAEGSRGDNFSCQRKRQGHKFLPLHFDMLQ